MIVLIPAFEPDARLLDLVAELREAARRLDEPVSVLIVDDGSGSEYAFVFAAARATGAEVIGYPLNRGKGHALKTGVRHILETRPHEVVVCADSDGQHRTADIVAVAARATDAADRSFVLGARRFTGRVPARSRLGNTVSSGLFRLATGLAVGDTQTGLRAYPPDLLPWLVGVKGERFEYEVNLLLDARRAEVRIEQVPIETVYLERNASSHFRPVTDSVRVLLPFVRYTVSSLGAFLLDLAALQVLFAVTGDLLVSVVGARLVSASVNFVVNRRLVFGGGGEHSHPKQPQRPQQPSLRRAAARYAALALVLLVASYGLLAAATAVGVALLPAKVLTDLLLFLAGFVVQRRFVFRSRPGRTARAAGQVSSRPSSPRGEPAERLSRP